MTDDELLADARRFLEEINAHDRALELAGLLIAHLLALGLRGDDEVATGYFIQATNDRLVDIAAVHGLRRVRLVADD